MNARIAPPRVRLQRGLRKRASCHDEEVGVEEAQLGDRGEDGEDPVVPQQLPNVCLGKAVVYLTLAAWAPNLGPYPLLSYCSGLRHKGRFWCISYIMGI